MIKWAFSFLFCIQICSAYEDAPRCFYDLADNFFHEGDVKVAMENYAIYESSWTPLWNDLKRNARVARERIKNEAKREAKNPLEHPFNPVKAKEILIRIEREIFTDTFNYWRIWDGDTIEGMFRYILEKNQRRINGCLPEPREEKKGRL